MTILDMRKLVLPPRHLGIQPDANAGVPATGGETIADILARGSERARQASLEYIGLVTPHEAMRLMDAAGARLIDVRTPSERVRTGRVRGSLAIAWRATGDAEAEKRFVMQLRRKLRPDEIVLFLSRNGERSHHAARSAALSGYVHALSVLEGYDGERVGKGRTRGGWRRHRSVHRAQAPVESALDEALEETFPASDPIPVNPGTDRK